MYVYVYYINRYIIYMYTYVLYDSYNDTLRQTKHEPCMRSKALCVLSSNYKYLWTSIALQKFIFSKKGIHSNFEKQFDVRV